MTSQNPASCSECARLAVQAGAALLTGDKSRQADVRVLQSHHHAAAHGRARTVPPGPGRRPVSDSPMELWSRYRWHDGGECWKCERSGVPVTPNGVLEGTDGVLVELSACLSCTWRLEHRYRRLVDHGAGVNTRAPLEFPPLEETGVQHPARHATGRGQVLRRLEGLT